MMVLISTQSKQHDDRIFNSKTSYANTSQMSEWS